MRLCHLGGLGLGAITGNGGGIHFSTVNFSIFARGNWGIRQESLGVFEDVAILKRVNGFTGQFTLFGVILQMNVMQIF